MVTDHTLFLHPTQVDFLSCDLPYRGFVAGRGAGKALALDTPVHTPSGLTPLSSLAVGSPILSDKGDPCTVTGLTPILHERPCYQLTFTDGEQIIADAMHEWPTPAGPAASLKTTEELFLTRQLSIGNGRPHCLRSILPCASVPVRCIEVNSPSHCYLVGHRRVPTHNSFVGAYDMLIRACSKRNRLYVIVSPTYTSLKDSTWRTFVGLAEQLGKIRRQVEHRITLDSGSVVVGRSAEHPHRLRGPNISGAWLDEAQLHTQDVYSILIGCLREAGEQGWLTATFTPAGKLNWTYEIFGLAEKRGAKNTKLFKCRTRDTPFLHDEFADDLASQYTSTMAAQELEGEFIEAGGKMFKREWFTADQLARAVPEPARRVRYWDLAASTDLEGGCFTAGVLMAATYDGRFFVENIVHGRWSPMQRNEIIKMTAQMDDARYGAAVVRILIEQEPGSSGKEVALDFVRLLAGYVVRPDKVTGKKVLRAEPFAAQCEAKRVFLVTSTDEITPWISRYLDELCSFPDGKFKDMVDASSGGFMALTRGTTAIGVVGGTPGSPGPSYPSPNYGQINAQSGLRGFKPL